MRKDARYRREEKMEEVRDGWREGREEVCGMEGWIERV